LSTGYWTIFDPTNGYTAVDTRVLSQLNLNKLSPRYFFESDILFRLGTVRALVLDIPMRAVYQEEKSSLRIGKVMLPFLWGHMRNFFKRIFYNYVLRDFTVASLELLFGLVFVLFGGVVGISAWVASAQTGLVATTGTVMLSALPIILGIQFLLSFVSYDVASSPGRPIHPLLEPPSLEWDAPSAPDHSDRSNADAHVA